MRSRVWTLTMRLYLERSVSQVMWYLYIIRCGDDTLYTGITTDVARRFGEHECGGPVGG